MPGSGDAAGPRQSFRAGCDARARLSEPVSTSGVLRVLESASESPESCLQCPNRGSLYIFAHDATGRGFDCTRRRSCGVPPAPKSPSRFVYFSRSYASREVSGARATRAARRDDRAAGADSTAELGRRPPQTHHGRVLWVLSAYDSTSIASLSVEMAPSAPADQILVALRPVLGFGRLY